MRRFFGFVFCSTLLASLTACSGSPSAACDSAVAYLIGQKEEARMSVHEILGTPTLPMPTTDSPSFSWRASYDRQSGEITLDRPPYYKVVLRCNQEKEALDVVRYVQYGTPPFSDRELSATGVYLPLSSFSGGNPAAWSVKLGDPHTGLVRERRCESERRIVGGVNSNPLTSVVVIDCREYVYGRFELVEGLQFQEWYATDRGLFEARLSDEGGTVVFRRSN